MGAPTTIEDVWPNLLGAVRESIAIVVPVRGVVTMAHRPGAEPGTTIVTFSAVIDVPTVEAKP